MTCVWGGGGTFTAAWPLLHNGGQGHAAMAMRVAGGLISPSRSTVKLGETLSTLQLCLTCPSTHANPAQPYNFREGNPR